MAQYIETPVQKKPRGKEEAKDKEATTGSPKGQASPPRTRRLL